MKRKNRGFALLAVFWISLLLGILALNYATTARLNAEAARNRRLGAEHDYLLRSAVAKGYHEYLKYRANRSLLAKKEEFEELSGRSLELWYPRYEFWECELEGVKIGVKIVGEAGKFKLNGLKIERCAGLSRFAGWSMKRLGTALLTLFSTGLMETVCIG